VLGRLIPAWIVWSLGLSVYWIFAVMMLDYGTKATLLVRRYRSNKWLDTAVAPPATKPTVDSDKKNT
jgi:Na+-driven multidrug efflux pump